MSDLSKPDPATFMVAGHPAPDVEDETVVLEPDAAHINAPRFVVETPAPATVTDAPPEPVNALESAVAFTNAEDPLVDLVSDVEYLAAFDAQVEQDLEELTDLGSGIDFVDVGVEDLTTPRVTLPAIFAVLDQLEGLSIAALDSTSAALNALEPESATIPEDITHAHTAGLALLHARLETTLARMQCVNANAKYMLRIATGE